MASCLRYNADIQRGFGFFSACRHGESHDAMRCGAKVQPEGVAGELRNARPVYRSAVFKVREFTPQESLVGKSLTGERRQESESLTCLLYLHAGY